MKQFYKWINLSCAVWRCVESCHRFCGVRACVWAGRQTHWRARTTKPKYCVHNRNTEYSLYISVSMRCICLDAEIGRAENINYKKKKNQQKQAKTRTRNQFYLIYLFIHLLLLLIMPIRRNEAKETQREKCVKILWQNQFLYNFLFVRCCCMILFLGRNFALNMLKPMGYAYVEPKMTVSKWSWIVVGCCFFSLLFGLPYTHCHLNMYVRWVCGETF